LATEGSLATAARVVTGAGLAARAAVRLRVRAIRLAADVYRVSGVIPADLPVLYPGNSVYVVPPWPTTKINLSYSGCMAGVVSASLVQPGRGGTATGGEREDAGYFYPLWGVKVSRVLFPRRAPLSSGLPTGHPGTSMAVSGIAQ
jgi:hypothetical protein